MSPAATDLGTILLARVLYIGWKLCVREFA